MISVHNLSKKFGGLKAVEDLNFSVEKLELVGIIGPNGAGKTTVFNLLTGVYAPTLGSIELNGKNIVGMKPYEILNLGLSRTFQNIRLFKDLTAIDNVLIGAHSQFSYGLWASIVETQKYFTQEKELNEKAMWLLSFFGLQDKALQFASNLSYGEQRKLEIARALASRPKIICLDEPAAGMNHHETEALMNMISQIRKEFSLTVLLIEHDMKLVMGICEKIIVLDHGMKIEEGSPSVIKKSAKVIEAYLGPEVS